MNECFFRRYYRYFKYMFQWVFLEKLRGLDFSMRDLKLLDESNGVYHGYSKTDESHANEIFSAIGVTPEMKILDIGCGKGAFLREAAKQSFSTVAGIEYVESIACIAERNFRKLHLDNRVKIYKGDATEFEHYGEYNVFYFFNPFDELTMKKVLRRISESVKGRVLLVLHHPTALEQLKLYDTKEVKCLFDKAKSYETRIYEWNII